MRIATPSRTTELLRRYEKHAAKRYGQNFLIDLSVVDRIAANAKLQPTTTVLEIGSGLGALSEACALSGAQVISYEIDDALIPILSESMATYPNVKIIHEDFLSADLSTFRTCDDLVVLANLPYYITTPILMKLMRDDLPIRQLNLMMQKEVAQRMSALPGTAEYGSLSVFIQFHFALKRLMVVKRTCFLPAPKVDSVVLTLTPRVREPVDPAFFEFVRGCFRMRRKTLINNLKGMLDPIPDLQALLMSVGLDVKIRPEQLSEADFLHLYSQVKPFLDKFVLNEATQKSSPHV